MSNSKLLAIHKDEVIADENPEANLDDCDLNSASIPEELDEFNCNKQHQH